MKHLITDNKTGIVREVEISEEQETSPALQLTEPTLEDRVVQVETKTVTLEQTLDILFGG